MKDLVLGIDTSNYRTSLAIVDFDGNVVFNHRKLLEVPEGERGLRQQNAFFQHVQKLPEVIEEALSSDDIRGRIAMIAVSSKPRPIEGSYMPCFTAGMGYAKALSSALAVPYKEYSHQEGHIEAIKFFSELKDEKNDFICFHFSGGTTEAVITGINSGRYELVGGTKDLAYGQVLDRVGVHLGHPFPAGEELDEIAVRSSKSSKCLTKIRVIDCFVNLSGIETQAQREAANHVKEDFVRELFEKLTDSIIEMCLQLSKKYEIKEFIFAGGVSSSRFLRRRIDERNLPFEIVFGKEEYSTDNAVGTALLGVRELTHGI